MREKLKGNAMLVIFCAAFTVLNYIITLFHPIPGRDKCFLLPAIQGTGVQKCFLNVTKELFGVGNTLAGNNLTESLEWWVARDACTYVFLPTVTVFSDTRQCFWEQCAFTGNGQL